MRLDHLRGGELTSVSEAIAVAHALAGVTASGAS
jgi:hypothetical protein